MCVCMHHMLNPRAYSFQPYVRSGMHSQAVTTMHRWASFISYRNHAGTIRTWYCSYDILSVELLQPNEVPTTDEIFYCTCRVGSLTDHSSIKRVWLIRIHILVHLQLSSFSHLIRHHLPGHIPRIK